MKLFSKPKWVLSIMCIVFVLLLIHAFRDWKAKEKDYLGVHVQATERSVHAILSSYEKTADLVVRTQIRTPDIESRLAAAWETELPSFRDAMRDSLFWKLSPLYQEMVGIGFRQFHFHFPDNTSFLRFHRPEKFGDDLTGIRKSVTRTNRERIKTVGFEEGRVRNGYRFVYPLVFCGRHVGSVEASISLIPVAEELSRMTEVQGAASATLLLVRKEEVDEKVWVDEQIHYIPSSLFDRYLVDAELSGGEEVDLERINDSVRSAVLPRMEKGESFALPASAYGQRTFLVEFLPQKDIDGEILGYLVHYERDRGFAMLRRFFFLRILSLSVFALAFLLFILYRQRFISKLHLLATTDPLTQVQNRRALLADLRQRSYLVQRYSRPYSLVMFDVDHFKDLNDGFGHALGDRVLREIVDICRGQLRETDLLARWGGDEFVILLTESDAENARIVAERIRKTVAERFAPDEYAVTLSLGVYQIPEGVTDPDPLFASVDAALYRAKEKGRNRVEVAVGE